MEAGLAFGLCRRGAFGVDPWLICSFKMSILVKGRCTEEVFHARLGDKRSCTLRTGFGTVNDRSNVLRAFGQRAASLFVDEFHLRQHLCLVGCRPSVASAATHQRFCRQVFLDPEYGVFLDSKYAGGRAWHQS